MSVSVRGSGSSAATKPTADLRRTTRFFAAALLPIGPAAVAILRFVLPYSTTDDPEEVVAAVQADPAVESAVLWLSLVAVLTLVPAAIWVGRLTRRHSPRLTAAALILLVPGYLSLVWLVTVDALLWSGVTTDVDGATLTRLVEATHPAVDVAVGIFVLGHVLGTILLGLALWLSRTVPRWAAVLTIVSQPLHFVAAVILASHTLDLVAWGMQAIGFAAAAWAIAHLRDTDWDLSPQPSPPGRSS